MQRAPTFNSGEIPESVSNPTNPRGDDPAAKKQGSSVTHLVAGVTQKVADTLVGIQSPPIANSGWAVAPSIRRARDILATDARLQRVPNQVNEILSNPQKGSSMAIISDIDYQLELLHQLDGELMRVRDDMEGMVAMYRQRLNQLADAGMIPQLWNDFHNNVFEETRADFGRLRDKIQTIDRVIVREYIGKVENLRPN